MTNKIKQTRYTHIEKFFQVTNSRKLNLNLLLPEALGESENPQHDLPAKGNSGLSCKIPPKPT